VGRLSLPCTEGCDHVTLRSRSASNLTASYPAVTAALRTLKAHRALLDDEIVALDAEGPFVNLPNIKHGRWGKGITAEDMASVVCVKPSLVAQVAFREWTDGGSLRHARFIDLRTDERAVDVVREGRNNGQTPGPVSVPTFRLRGTPSGSSSHWQSLLMGSWAESRGRKDRLEAVYSSEVSFERSMRYAAEMLDTGVIDQGRSVKLRLKPTSIGVESRG